MTQIPIRASEPGPQGTGSRSGTALAYRILLIVFFVLLAVFLAGTVFVLVRRGQAAGGQSGGNQAPPGESIFKGLGTIRVSTPEAEPASLIISVVFPYNPGDRPFSEELVSRIGDMKNITVEYFGSFTAETLKETDAAVISKELLGRYNALLRLGQIKELYFLDFIWL
jgi:flagellar basal body-associated protein FliL